jgi:hypothetical protein
MKITKTRLEKIIKEEVSKMVEDDGIDLGKEKHDDHMYSDYDPDPLVAIKMALDVLRQKYTNPKPGEGKDTLDALAAWRSLDKVYSQMRSERKVE